MPGRPWGLLRLGWRYTPQSGELRLVPQAFAEAKLHASLTRTSETPKNSPSPFWHDRWPRLFQEPAKTTAASHRVSGFCNRPSADSSDRGPRTITARLPACRPGDTCDERARNVRGRRRRFFAGRHALEGCCPAHSADSYRRQSCSDRWWRVQLQLWSQAGLSQTSRIFSGGTITYAADRASGSVCGQQVFHVRATLATANDADDSGLLEAYLTHHRRSVLGRCITYAATVRGSLKLVN